MIVKLRTSLDLLPVNRQSAAHRTRAGFQRTTKIGTILVLLGSPGILLATYVICRSEYWCCMRGWLETNKQPLECIPSEGCLISNFFANQVAFLESLVAVNAEKSQQYRILKQVL